MLLLERISLVLACSQLALRPLDRGPQRLRPPPQLLCHVCIPLTILTQCSELLQCCRPVCVRVICFLPAYPEIVLERVNVGDGDRVL